MRYYSTQRPVVPDSYPQNGVVNIHNFSVRKFCVEIGRKAWGYIDYDRDLTADEIRNHELTPAGVKLFWCVTTSINDKGRIICSITDVVEAAAKPEDNFTRTKLRDIYNDWFDSCEEAEKFVADAKKA